MAKKSPVPNFYQAQSYRPEESAGYLMKQVMNLLASEIEAELQDSTLTSAQWQPLFKLHLGQAGTVAELARECRLDTGAMTRMLDRLEAKGLVTRERSSTDRRVVNLALTDAGREAAQKIPAVLSKVQNNFLQGFSHEEWQQLKDLLRRVLANGQALQAQRNEGSKE